MRQRLYLVLQLFAFWLLIPGVIRGQWNPLNPVLSVQREHDGVQATLQNGTLKLRGCSDSIIRVRYSPAATFSSRPELVVIKDNLPSGEWALPSSEYAMVFITSQL